MNYNELIKRVEDTSFKYDNVSSVSFAVCLMALVCAFFAFFSMLDSSSTVPAVLFALCDGIAVIAACVGFFFKLFAVIKDVEVAVLKIGSQQKGG